MKKILVMILITMLSSALKAQINLVPNPSFEQLDSCPDALGQIDRCVGWENYGPQITTPDYYNACATVQSGFNVPNGVLNFQYAHSGNSFAGLTTFWPPVCFPYSCKEHIGIQLSQSLTIGQKYFISFYVVLGGEKITTLMPSNKIGVKLSTIPYNTGNPVTISNFAHLYTDSIITDSVSWTLISGSFIADSAYQYLIAGNFFDDANTDTIKWFPNSVGSYYLVDDFCISTDSLLCNTISSVSSAENTPNVNIFPNPLSSSINVTFDKGESGKLIIADLTGRVLIQNLFHEKKGITLDVSFFSQGCYLLKIISQRKETEIIKKFIKL